MNVVTPLIRSQKLLRAARGQPCTLRFPGICNYNPETTVACHVRDGHKGMGIKASDHSIVFGCSACHRHFDETGGDQDFETIVRALQETWGLLIAFGVVVVPVDAAPKPRGIKPKGQRGPSRPMRQSEPQRTASSPIQRKSERTSP